MPRILHQHLQVLSHITHGKNATFFRLKIKINFCFCISIDRRAKKGEQKKFFNLSARAYVVHIYAVYACTH
jgi:hypothetical protein